MPIGPVLLASDDPVTIQLFIHSLQELSISPEVCREVPAAVTGPIFCTKWIVSVTPC
jgi:hypothetical protein